MATGYGFTGERWEAYSELAFLRARYYEPVTGRFLSKDPSARNISAPQTWNSYLYADNRPVSLVDPSGHAGEQPLPSSDACNTWSGIAKLVWCEPAERGSLAAKYDLYQWIARMGRIGFGWDVAADLLEHYLDRTGTYVVLDSRWLLNGPEDRRRRDELYSEFVDDHLKPETRDCALISVQAVLAPRDKDVVVAPRVSTDIGVAIGGHWLDGFFTAIIEQCCPYVAEVKAHYQVIDYYDFDPKKGLGIDQLGVGLVPHQWLIDLRDAGWAAEFDIYVSWQERSVVQWD